MSGTALAPNEWGVMRDTRTARAWRLPTRSLGARGWARACRGSVPVLVLVSCVSCADRERSARAAGSPEVPRVAPEWEVREPRVEGAISAEHPQLRPVAFRATEGLVVLLTTAPAGTWLFLYDRPEFPAHGLIPRGGRTVQAFRGEPSDIVEVTEAGEAWLLSTATGALLSRTTGSGTTSVGNVGAERRASRACRSATDTVVWLDREAPGRLYVRALSQHQPAHVLEVPMSARREFGRMWSHVQLAGSTFGGCVLWAPQSREVLLVRGRDLRLLTAPEDTDRPRGRLLRLLSQIGFGRPSPRIRDATTYARGVAILREGPAGGGGAIVDFVLADGTRLPPVRLQRPALRIAGARYRFFVLSQQSDTIRLASYALPFDARPPRTDATEQVNRVVPRIVR